MRKLLFRFVLIGIIAMSMMQITDENSKNYGTQISSSIGNIKIDVPEVISDVSDTFNKAKKVAASYIETLLEEFGYTAEIKEERKK